MEIVDIYAIQILDSRANPTLQVDVILSDGSRGSFQVPSGASTGIHEAHELRDNDSSYYHGKSVLNAIANIEKVKTHLCNANFTQETLDQKLKELDGSENKEIIGANAMLGISVAFAKASAKFYNLPLYEYLFRLYNSVKFENKTQEKLPEVHLFANVINGGLHAGNKLPIQEFMLVPTFGTLQEKVQAISEVYIELKKLIEKKYGKQGTSVGDEGGFAPSLSKATQALDLLTQAVKQAQYTGKIAFALDAAASDFYDEKTKKYEVEPNLNLSYKKLTAYYNELIKKYDLISIEDPMAEDDFEGFSYFKENVMDLDKTNPLINSKKLLIVGDDLLVTNPKRIEIAKEKDLCNSLLLKINQIGTLSESLEAHRLSQQSNWHTIVSHRSGETPDDFISDLAVALKSSIKLGAPARGERVAKYNRLLNIYS